MRGPRKPGGPPGIVDVAARAGVSIATVSRAFARPDMVRADTRRRIEEAARDLGYIRDRVAGAMHTRFSGTVGLIVPTIDNAIFAEMIEAFSTRLRERDRTMLIAAHGYDLSLETGIVRSLLERRIDGVALVGFAHESVPLTMLESRGVPVISIWNWRADSPLPCIGADNARAARLVTEHLIARGHRDIAFLFPDSGFNDRAGDRIDGALAAMAEAGLAVPSRRRLTCPYDMGAAKDIAARLLGDDPPTGIVCGNDVIAHGVIFAATALGRRVPADVSVVGIGDLRGSAQFEPGLTTVRLPARRIGTLAADTLVEMSESGRAPDPFRRAVDVSFVERASTGPPRAERSATPVR
jgi:LacI family transcriptional regulator